MKRSEFQKYNRGNAVYMKRLSMDNKGCGQLSSNDTYFDDRWFSSVKTAEELMPAGVDYCRTLKTRHSGFCLDT